VSVDGVLVVDKPSGLTSHDVVAVARRSLGEKRIGHTGTLDPLATGVLPLACGRATRLVRFLIASDKDYDAVIRFGLVTDTYDISGTELQRCERRPTRAAIDEALASLRGDYLQAPPPFSAKKIGGTRAYTLARSETAVELRPVPVTVTRADLVDFDGYEARIALTCSSGFYVRSFGHELGQRLGTGACLKALRRIRSGQFRLNDAVNLEELQAATAVTRMLPLEALLPALPATRLTNEGRERVGHGREIEPGQYEPLASSSVDWVRLLDSNGRLLGLAEPGNRPGSLHPAVVLI
jgi:tRNA pseudouridine55 synthase